MKHYDIKDPEDLLTEVGEHFIEDFKKKFPQLAMTKDETEYLDNMFQSNILLFIIRLEMINAEKRGAEKAARLN